MTFLQLRLCRNIKTLSPSLSPSRLFVGNVTCNPSKERETGTNTKLTRSDCLISLLFHTSLKENSSRPCFYQYSRNKTPPEALLRKRVATTQNRDFKLNPIQAYKTKQNKKRIPQNPRLVPRKKTRKAGENLGQIRAWKRKCRFPGSKIGGP